MRFVPLRRVLERPHLGIAVFFFAAVVVAVVLTTRGPETTPLYRAADFASHRGNDAFLWAGDLALLLVALKSASRAWAWRVVRVMLAQTVLVHVTKLATGPWLPRPSGNPGGFPSGHASAAFALAFLLSERFPRAAVLWYALAAVIAWSRVEVGSHYPYQVAAGMALGLASAFLLHDVPARWQRRQKDGVTPADYKPTA